MNKLILMFTFVDSIITLAFLLFGLNVLWSFAEAGEGIFGLAVILGTTSVFNALSALVRGYVVDSFQKKITVLVSLIVCCFLCILWFFTEHFLPVAVIAYIAIEFARAIYNSSYAALVAEKLSSNDYVKYDSISIMVGRVISVIGNLASAVAIIFIPSEVIAFLIAAIFIVGAVVCRKFLPGSSVKSDAEHYPKNLKTAWVFAKENVFGDRKIVTFIVIVFLLNLDYAFIPTLLPMFIITTTELTSPLLFGIIRSGNSVGEFVASAITLKYSRFVSRLTKIGLAGSAAVFILLPFIYAFPVAVVAFFAMYSFFDMLTQPLYSYFVSSLKADKRGRILGIVDSTILLASPLGIAFGGVLSHFGMIPVSVGIVAVFLFSLLIISKSKDYKSVKLDC